MNNPGWNTLISAAVLHQQLHNDNLVLIDCRFELGNAAAGHHAYRHAHLPTAQYAHLNDHLSGPVTATSGRHPLPGVKSLSATFSRWGIDSGKQVIAYDADNGAMAAARLWWLLRWLGHEQVAVLDGGIKHWQASGFELSNSTFAPATREFKASVQSSWVVDADVVAQRTASLDWRIVDARAAERYAGEVEPLDPVAGHVPGAKNYPFARNLQSDGRFLPAATLRDQFHALLGAIPATHIINMCGSGVTACHNLLAMEIAGIHGAKLYAGSWSEWSRQQRPVATSRNL
jgi:thiosulfate/3-mercaptopyruvate sulfurtransferase